MSSLGLCPSSVLMPLPFWPLSLFLSFCWSNFPVWSARVSISLLSFKWLLSKRALAADSPVVPITWSPLWSISCRFLISSLEWSMLFEFLFLSSPLESVFIDVFCVASQATSLVASFDRHSTVFTFILFCTASFFTRSIFSSTGASTSSVLEMLSWSPDFSSLVERLSPFPDLLSCLAMKNSSSSIFWYEIVSKLESERV